MQPTPEELELKEHVTKTLTTQGVLGKIKAQLRAAVFHVVQEYEPDAELVSTSRKLQAFGKEGEVALDVIVDFLEFFQLDHSLVVLKAEANVETTTTQRGLTLQKELKEVIGETEDASSPLLIQMLLHARSLNDSAKPKSSTESRWRQDEEDVPYRRSGLSLPSNMKAEETILRKEFEDDALLENVATERRQPTATTLEFANHKEDYSKSKANEEDEGDKSEDEMDASVVSELSESIAEEEQQSASMTYSQDYGNVSKDEQSFGAIDEKKKAGQTGGVAYSSTTTVIREEDEEGEHMEAARARTAKEDNDDAFSPPPAPMSISTTSTAKETEEDEFDEELEVARLSSLDAKLKAMEAEDETGTLQQLKATLLQGDDDALKKPKSTGTGGGNEDHDAYGSDFEEEEVVSEVSDDEIGSVSDLPSEQEESVSSSAYSNAPTPVSRAPPTSKLDDEKAVDDENALNSYDYIEEVERGW
ncbi:Fgfr1 oncogene, partial [Globisporangium splendens]